MSAAIRFRDLTLGYDRHPAVHHLDGDVESGDLLAICGPNGAGKSTLLKGIVGSLKPLSGGPVRRCGAARIAKVEDAIAAVGLEGFESRVIGTLSGGQLQRMLFARLLLQDAPIILLDEPFTAIDSKTVSDLLALVARWNGEKRTVLAVLHDEELVRAHFPQTLLLAREKIAWGKTADVLTPHNLLKARAMVEAFDRDAPTCGHAA